LGGLFFGHVFLFAGSAQLFVFWLLPYDNNQLQKPTKQCAACARRQKA
jgi:hypothetical protein